MITNRQGLAEVMGVSLPTIDRWISEGCPYKTRGKKGIQWEFMVPDVVAWWGNRERESAAGTSTADENELKRRKLLAETRRAELEFAKAAAEVAPVAEFERATARMLAGIRANVMNVPARAVLQLLGETNEVTFKQALRAELTLALEQSSAIDFDLDDDADDDAEAAPSADE
ncbi:MAG: DNA-packaging protein [Sphingopyxis macrogoltabida]|uniref:DNA-packaging protein n=1 Tax=Sphingopyxis macrogoltabida TaxID=33050 RepID=A0A2W5KVY7_SPHMC|nr:MAG: DNA-packaging protein [Sphingopyxis macrogoltabida]